MEIGGLFGALTIAWSDIYLFECLCKNGGISFQSLSMGSDALRIY